MARSNIDGAVVADCLVLNGNRFGLLRQTLTATFAIPPDAPHLLILDANGVARNVTLPASPQVGDWFEIYNSAAAAFSLTLQNSAAAAVTPAVVIAQSKAARVIYTGLAEPGGWRALSGA